MRTVCIVTVGFFFAVSAVQFFMGRDEHSEEEENALIGDVVLPPWASSAHHFIHTHREVKRRAD